MGSRIPRLLLFDIDGTLTHSAHKDAGNPILNALSASFGQTITRNGIAFSGGTDPSICRELLTGNGILPSNCMEYDLKILEAFKLLPGIMKDGMKNESYTWNILPNVNNLLEALSKRNDVRLALLTGNLQTSALLKLQSAGVVTNLFIVDGVESNLFGAFGSDHGDRSQLVKIAKERYEKLLGCSIMPNDMVIIGDSSKDIECAHSNNVPCVAVTTGNHGKKDLEHADRLLDGGFVDIEESIQAILQTKR
uniref:Uncharacterized protein LOC100181103 n=1 Tax=Phallusia mammillata TaxID=59560 RepID=A0A6F9DGU6_9ASCI|nr:uncharacterized protein LOC100181103 [Phallusia mammillata]